MKAWQRCESVLKEPVAHPASFPVSLHSYVQTVDFYGCTRLMKTNSLPAMPKQLWQKDPVKNVHHNVPEPTVTSLNVLFCLNNSPKPQIFKFLQCRTRKSSKFSNLWTKNISVAVLLEKIKQLIYNQKFIFKFMSIVTTLILLNSRLSFLHPAKPVMQVSGWHCCSLFKLWNEQWISSYLAITLIIFYLRLYHQTYSLDYNMEAPCVISKL